MNTELFPVIIAVDRDPHNAGYHLFQKETAMFMPGFTTLVGCNGVGKTSLLNQIANTVMQTRPGAVCWHYDNLTDGGERALNRAIDYGQMINMMLLACGSAGESIYENVGEFIKRVGAALCKTASKEVWILLDAVDSGMSIDNIIEIKDFFERLMAYMPKHRFYIIASANAYEMTCDTCCLDVASLEYVMFADYPAYREFVLASRRQRDALSRFTSSRMPRTNETCLWDRMNAQG